jgi:hypothetical protein
MKSWRFFRLLKVLKLSPVCCEWLIEICEWFCLKGKQREREREKIVIVLVQILLEFTVQFTISSYTVENQNSNRCLDLLNFRYCCGILGFCYALERSPHDIVEWLFAAFHSSYYNYPEHSLTQRSSNLQLLMNSNRTMPQNELSQGSGSGATSTFTSLQTNTHPKTTSLNFFDYIRTLSILAKGDLAARRRWAFLFLYMSSQIITHHKDQRKMESSPILHTNTKSTNNSSSTTIETSQTMNKIASVEESSSSTTIATLQHRVAMSSNEKVWLPPYMDLTQLTLNPEHIISMLTGVVEFFRVLTLNIERKAKRIQEIQSALQHYQHTITLAHYQQAPLVDNIVRLLLDVDPSLHVTVQHLLSSPPTTAENSMVSKHKQGHAVFFGIFFPNDTKLRNEYYCPSHCQQRVFFFYRALEFQFDVEFDVRYSVMR